MAQMAMLSHNTEIVLLLCGRFGGEDRGDLKPLTPSEYNKLARWLDDQGLHLSLLPESGESPDGFEATGLEWERVDALLRRGPALALAAERWLNHGLWVISRADEGYPTRYKKQLRGQAPPLLYGVGDRSLLQDGGLAIVGSRDVDQAGSEFAEAVVNVAARNNVTIISGGARGVDQTAMLAAIEAGGAAVGVLADSLGRRAVYGPYRDAIRDQRLALISPFGPDAGFSVGNAMARNKLIYTLADHALVVASAAEKSGTLAGAKENLKRGWVPLLVRAGDNVPAGNRLLIELGGIPLRREALDSAPSLSQLLVSLTGTVPTGATESGSPADEAFEAIWSILSRYLDQPRRLDDLWMWLDKTINKRQLTSWLNHAVDEGRARRLTRPVRYEALSTSNGRRNDLQQPLFSLDD